MNTLTVTVLDREAEARLWPCGLQFRTVTISDRCPKCGGPRGVPVRRPFCEDGEFYSVHCWVNPCGHVDRYADVIREGGAA